MSGNNTGGSNFGGGESHITGGSIVNAPVDITVRLSFAETIGDGTTTVFPITHNLNTLDTMQEVYNPLTGAQIPPTAFTVVHTSPNVTTFTFTTAPAAGAARVVIKA